MEAAISLRAREPEPVRLLVVAAEPIVREWVVYRLADDRFEIELAVDLGEALHAIGGVRFDVILVDPDRYSASRDRLLEAVREAAPEAAVVVLSESCDTTAVTSAVRAGVRGYLSKASTRLDLAGTLRTAMRGILTLDESSLQALVNASDSPGPTATPLLSNQELRVLELVAQGLTNREIGAQLFLSPHTVKNYLRNAADKLGVASRLDAVLEAAGQGLIELPPGSARTRVTALRSRRALGVAGNVWALVNEFLGETFFESLPTLSESLPLLPFVA